MTPRPSLLRNQFRYHRALGCRIRPSRSVHPVENVVPRSTAVASSPDAKTILTGCNGPHVRLWEAVTGQPLGRPMEHSGFVRCRGVQPRWQAIVTAERKTARLWDAATGRLSVRPWSIQTVSVRGVQPRRSDDPHRKLGQHGAAVGRHHRPSHWPASGSFGLCVQPWLSAPTAGRSSPAATTRRRGFGISPPASRSVSPCSIGFGESMAFSPDGKTIVTGWSDRSARLWDAATGQPIGPPMPHT